ncbi:radical SAM protein [Candidatus Pacearchaeota archaeon]|nr:radical SAM protein [Candidatus Pacearchaeota archaeon]
MNVLLLNAPWSTESGYGVRSNSRWPHTRKDKALPFPIYLAYTAAILEKNNIRVDIIDAVAEEKTLSQITDLIKSKNYDLVVIETSTPSIDFDLKAAEEVKKVSKARIVLIGPHATHFDKELLKHDFVDIIARGEFEYTILDICNKKLMEVEGITYKENKETKRNKDRPLIEDLDNLPFPDRHLFKMSHYDSHLYKSPSFLMITSRGCPYQCTYCLWPQVMYGHKFRARSAKSVVDEMELLIKKHGAREICFDDDTFTIGKERVIEICREIIQRNLKIEWSCFGRVGLDEETLREMKEAGCEHIRYGVESGSQELLNRCKKFTNIPQIKETFKLTKKVGIRDYGTFMIGLPGETWKTVDQTIELAKELDPYAVQFSIVIPFPGTEYYSELKEQGMLKAKTWADFDGSTKSVIETKELSKEDLEKAFALAWKKFYLRPSYVIKSTLRHLRSLQDMKRLFGGAKSFLTRWMYYRKMLK